MSPTILQIIIAVVLILHGFGHLIGAFPAIRPDLVESFKNPIFRNWTSRSWLLTDTIGITASQVICAILFSLTCFGFIGAGVAIFGKTLPHESWRIMAISSAVVSLGTITLFWDAFILFFPHKLGAIIINAACLVLLLNEWSSEAAIGF